jgi:hypothetical protein
VGKAQRLGLEAERPVWIGLVVPMPKPGSVEDLGGQLIDFQKMGFRQPTEELHRAPVSTWKAGFISLLGDPLPGALKGKSLLLVGSGKQSVDLTMGTDRARRDDRQLVKRLQQGHFMITQIQRATCMGKNSVFLTDPKNEVCKCWAKNCANTGVEQQFFEGWCVGEGDHMIGYWDFSRVSGRTAAACILMMTMKGSSIPEVICYVTKVIMTRDDEGSDLVALYMLHELILSGVGVNLHAELGILLL